jgi:DNA-binding FrmR family transcriptional regulator
MWGGEERYALVTRLSRIEGQLRGIGRMIEDQRPCEEILQQLAAAQGALRPISLAILKVYLAMSFPLETDAAPSDLTTTLQDLMAILERYLV